MIELPRHWRLKEMDGGDHADGGHGNTFVIMEYAGTPTVEFDAVDTAGVGRKMRVNSVVRNTLTNKYYSCHDATAGSAVWVELGSGGGSGGSGIAIWSSGTEYAVDAVILYADRFWKCTALHTSGASFDITKFLPLSEGVRKITAVGHGLAVKNIVRPSGVGYVKAQADIEGNISNPPSIVWMVSGDTYVVVTGGIVTLSAHGYNLDTVYYTSDATAGAVVIEAPSVSNAVFRVIDANNIMMYWGAGGGGSSMKVNQPVNTSPSSGETGVVLSPTFTASAFSTLPLNADTHQMSDWEVATDSGFVTVVASNYSDTVNLASWTTASVLATGVQHWWRVRYQGTGLGWSKWSDGTSFTTRYVVTPSGTTPANGATGVSRTPALNSSAFNTSPGGVDTHLHSDWEVATDIGFTSIVESSYNDTVNKTSYTVSTLLGAGATYYYRVRHTGTLLGDSSWSTGVIFTTGAVNKAVNIDPTDAEIGVSLGGPLVSSAFATTPVACDTQLSADWEVYSDAGMTTLVRSSYDNTSSLTSWTVTADLNILTQYWGRVRHKGTAMGFGAWSDLTRFTTLSISVATPSITSPSEGATGVLLTPTITSSAFDTVPAGQDTHLSSDWEIATDSGFVTVVRSSYADTVNKTSWTVGTGLAINTTYYVRVRHTGNVYGDSSWSTGVSFTTVNIYVATPSVTSPSEGATVGRTPTITSSAFDTVPTGQDTHTSSDWEIATDVLFTTVVSSSYNDTVNKVSWASSTQLTAGITHYVRVRHTGTTYGDSAWSAGISFEVSAGVQKIVSGENNVTFNNWETYGKLADLIPNTTTVVYTGYSGFSGVNKGVIGSVNVEAGTSNFLKSTLSNGATIENQVFSCGYADGSVLQTGSSTVSGQIHGFLSFFNTSGGVITRKSVLGTPAGQSSYTYSLCTNSAKTQAMATGYHVNTGYSTQEMGHIMYSSDPSTGTCIARGYYESGRICVFYQGPGCFTSDGNMCAIGYSGDGTTDRATLLKVNTSLDIQSQLRVYVGSLASYFNCCVPSSTVSNGVYCAGYASTASNGTTAIITYFTTTHQWSKLYKMANNVNSDLIYRIAENASYVYVLIVNYTLADGGYGILCLNKTNGNVVWARKTNRAEGYALTTDLKVVGSDLIVCGYHSTSSTAFVASFNTTTGAVNYLKDSKIEYPFKPCQIEIIADGYMVIGKAEDEGVFANLGAIKNPHESPSFFDASWSYVTFTPYTPADTISTATPAFSTYTPTLSTALLPLTTPDLSWTVKDIPDYKPSTQSKRLTSMGANINFSGAGAGRIATYYNNVIYTCGYYNPAGIGYYMGRLGAINISNGTSHLAKRLYQSGITADQSFGYGGSVYADGMLCVGSATSIPGNSIVRPAIAFTNPSTGDVTHCKYMTGVTGASYTNNSCTNPAKTQVMATGYHANTGYNSTNIGHIMYSSDPSTGTCIARGYYESGRYCVFNRGPGCFTSDGNMCAIGYSGDGTTDRATLLKVNTSLDIQSQLRVYVGSLASYFNCCVPSSTVSNGVYCAGYASTASNGSTAIITYFTTAHQWSKLYKMANNTNGDAIYRIAENASYVYVLIANSTSADGGDGILCLNKSNGNVVWARKTNRTDVYTVLRDLCIIGSDLIVCGNLLNDANTPMIASFNATTGAVNYVKQGIYTATAYPHEIIPTDDGFCLVNEESYLATINNPHLSTDWFDATDTLNYVTFTPYSPADSITTAAPSFSTYTPTVSSLTVLSTDTGDTVVELV